MKPLALLALLLTVACNRGETPQPVQSTAALSGNPARGQALAAQYGCTICHVIPGVEGPNGSLGPSLQGVASRATLSFGTVQNTPANLVRFIQAPSTMNPQSSMPPIELTPTDAQDLAAFLGTLR